MVRTPENFMIIQWQEHCEKVIDGQTDKWTDRSTDRNVHSAAWLQLKKHRKYTFFPHYFTGIVETIFRMSDNDVLIETAVHICEIINRWHLLANNKIERNAFS